MEEELKDFRIFTDNESAATDYIKDKTFLLIGTFEISHEYYIDFIEEYGGLVTNHISDDIDYVLVGYDAFDNYKKESKLVVELDLEMITSWTFSCRTYSFICIREDLEDKPIKKEKRTIKNKKQSIKKNVQSIPNDNSEKIGKANNTLEEKVFCITGTLSEERDDFATFITNSNGTFRPTITKNVQYLIVGEDAIHMNTEKLRIAIERNINIITEEEFMNLAGVNTILRHK